jgi:hypothetical protein
MSERFLTEFQVAHIGEGKVHVTGYVYGLLGVHRPAGYQSQSVTHLPTGRKVIGLYKEADAIQLFCERLQAAVDLDTPDIKEASDRIVAWMGDSKTALQDLADECGPDLEDDEEDDEDECYYNCDNLRDRLHDTRRDLTNLRRELLTLSETLSTTTIMATARRLRELGEGA